MALHPPDETSRSVIVYTDGASKGNPGRAGIGVHVVSAKLLTTLLEHSAPVGIATNNYAEWMAFIEGMKAAKSVGAVSVIMRTDSQLVAKQFTGDYRVKDGSLRVLMRIARDLATEFDSFLVEHIPRERNRIADSLSTRGANAN